MSNTNCENIKNSDNCYSCYSCYSCNSCNYCNSCYSCYSCNSCYSCYSCNSCNYCNYCDFSYGLRMSEKMIFCLGEGRWESKGDGYQKNLQIFNTPVSEDEYKKVKSALSVKNLKLPIVKWIDIKDIESPTTNQTQLGGTLKTLSYKDAWTEMWSTLSQEDKNFFKELPHFNSEIFEKITGIKIEDDGLVGQEVEVTIGDKTYKAKII